MAPSRRELLRLGLALPLAGAASAADAPPADPRRGPLKTLHDHFPFAVPATAADWDARRTALRTQVRVALGLWPEPPKTLLDPVIHGKIERDGYTIEKVFFRSRPGVTVSGNLYRPTPPAGRRPAVLFAHGHWNDGRFHVASEKAAERDVAAGAEGDAVSARYFMQALPVSLARRGFVVFQYDMLGYADSTPLVHRETFTDAASQLWLPSVMGLQTWNSVRALDFLAGLPDVDRERLGMTGASGGGTQTFLLAAIDDRLAAAFPAVMVSTAMQGGCVCENANYIRIGTGNVELASLFAPKPLAMSGADDWTKGLMTDGFPEMQKLWALLGKPENVAAKVWPEYKHNYNRPAREFMAAWFEKHLMGRLFSAPERPFEPVPPKELSVFDASHPRPTGELGGRDLEATMRDEGRAWLAGLAPANRAGLDRFLAVARPAFTAMVGGDALPPAVGERGRGATVDGRARAALLLHTTARRPGSREEVPITAEVRSVRLVVVWLHPDGADAVGRDLAGVRRAGATLVLPDLLGVGRAKLAAPRPVDPKYAAFTFGYNRPLLADRVRDVLLAIAWARSEFGAARVHLGGEGAFGVVALLARTLAGDWVGRCCADAHRFRWDDLRDANDPRMLPGALKYGGLPGVLALAAPHPLLVTNDADAGSDTFAHLAYLSAGAPDALVRSSKPVPVAEAADWLLSGVVPAALQGD